MVYGPSVELTDVARFEDKQITSHRVWFSFQNNIVPDIFDLIIAQKHARNGAL